MPASIFERLHLRRNRPDTIIPKPVARDSEPAEDLDFLLQDGKIEELVRDGRTPLQIGRIGVPAGEMHPYYQFPPIGFGIKNLREVYMGDGGAMIFVNNDGREEVGPTYTLTQDQAALVDQRVNQEKAKLGAETTATA